LACQASRDALLPRPRYSRAATEIGKGQFLLVEDEELEAIEIESTHTIDIDSFVPRTEIDRRFFDTPYYITPNDPVGQDAFAVIQEAMRSKALVARKTGNRLRQQLVDEETREAVDGHEKARGYARAHRAGQARTGDRARAP
jgi:non-homologous end joining protein Ku